MGGYVKRPSDAHPQLNLQARVLMKYGTRIVVSGRPLERREKQRRLQLNADPRLRLPTDSNGTTTRQHVARFDVAPTSSRW